MEPIKAEMKAREAFHARVEKTVERLSRAKSSDDVDWAIRYSLRLVAESYNVLSHLRRLSSAEFDPRRRLERAILDEAETEDDGTRTGQPL